MGPIEIKCGVCLYIFNWANVHTNVYQAHAKFDLPVEVESTPTIVAKHVMLIKNY